MSMKKIKSFQKTDLQVEKRGLDIIGIYRLCGSETKKNMLRDAFEESPEIVDLSSENVPDINVITGKKHSGQDLKKWARVKKSIFFSFVTNTFVLMLPLK
jgi:RhoGAP domain